METIMNRVSAVVPFEDAFPQTLPWATFRLQ
jgi:hypothetical protein